MTYLTRREVLAGSASLVIAGATTPALTRSTDGLEAIARAKGLRFGSCVAWAPPNAEAGSFANAAYAALLEQDCGLLVAENEFKWQALRPDAKRFDFRRFDAILAYAETKRMKMRGHTLLWHKTERFPKWLNGHDFGPHPRREAERLLGGHITTVCQRYSGRIVSYDVVNETIDERTGGQRSTSLSRAFGDATAMTDFAFHAAREAAPGVELVYNDYVSWEPGNEVHRTGVLRLLEGFRKRGVPVDTLGVQSHIGVYGEGAAAHQEKPWRAFLDEVVAMGYRLAITELDVNDKALPRDVGPRDQAVADYAAAYLNIMLTYPQLRDVVAWGMCDKYSWLQGFSPRTDGAPLRPTPYDAQYRAKPLHTAIARQLAAASPRVN